MMIDPSPVKPRGFSTRDAAIFLGLSALFLEKARIGQTRTPGPRATKIGKRVVYLREDLEAYLDNPPT